MGEGFRLWFEFALGLLLPALLIHMDEQRNWRRFRVSPWNSASYWSAVIGFGPLAVLAHFIRTRRSVLGCLQGLGWLVLLVLVSSVI